MRAYERGRRQTGEAEVTGEAGAPHDRCAPATAAVGGDEEQPAAPDPLDSFGLYAIVVTWMEADVIAATVRNALTQGCERVILVDNDSPDDTVAAAIAAGAELGTSFSTPQLDEILKIRLLNETVARVSEASPHDHIWWLWLDADEFVHGPAARRWARW